MISRKDFVAVANAIKNGKTKSDIALMLCDYFKGENPNFDRQRFIAACQKETILNGIEEWRQE